MQLLGTSDGWVQTSDELAMTTDGGASWADITPAMVPGAQLGGAFFLNTSRGWVGLAGQSDASTTAPVFRTTDGGAIWTSSEVKLPAPPFGVYGPWSFDFVDPSHGWAVVGLGSNANFSYGELLGTDDGGKSWRELASIGHPVRFVTLLDGYAVAGRGAINGSGTDGVYATHDGGKTWDLVPGLDVPSGSIPIYGLPSFWAASDGVLPVVFSNHASSSFGTYVTHDAGASWSLGPTVSLAEPVEQDVTVSVQAVDASTWWAMPGPGQEVLNTDTGGRTWSSVPTTASQGAIQEVDFVK